MTPSRGNATESSPAVSSGFGLNIIQLIAGGAAAAVASIVGGRLGVAGTVVGAFIVSVVAGIALPIFRHSLEKSREKLKSVAPRRLRPGRGAVPPGMGDGGPSRAVGPAGDHDPKRTPRRKRTWLMLASAAAIFVVGLGSILGIQSATGKGLSHGTSQLQNQLPAVLPSVQAPAAPTPSQTPEPTDQEKATPGPSAPADVPTDQPSAPAPEQTAPPEPSQAPTAPDQQQTPPSNPPAQENPPAQQNAPAQQNPPAAQQNPPAAQATVPASGQ